MFVHLFGSIWTFSLSLSLSLSHSLSLSLSLLHFQIYAGVNGCTQYTRMHTYTHTLRACVRAFDARTHAIERKHAITQVTYVSTVNSVSPPGTQQQIHELMINESIKVNQSIKISKQSSDPQRHSTSRASSLFSLFPE